MESHDFLLFLMFCQNFRSVLHSFSHGISFVFFLGLPTNWDRFKERGIRGYLSFSGPTQVWPIWPFVWNAWKYAPLMCSTPSEIYFCGADFVSTIA